MSLAHPFASGSGSGSGASSSSSSSSLSSRARAPLAELPLAPFVVAAQHDASINRSPVKCGSSSSFLGSSTKLGGPSKHLLRSPAKAAMMDEMIGSPRRRLEERATANPSSGREELGLGIALGLGSGSDGEAGDAATKWSALHGQAGTSALPLATPSPTSRRLFDDVIRSRGISSARSDRTVKATALEDSPEISPSRTPRARTSRTGTGPPATPTDTLATPTNARSHRPAPLTGPKVRVEPSPSFDPERRLTRSARAASRSAATGEPRTPSSALPPADLFGSTTEGDSVRAAEADAAEANRTTPLLQSLPRKKERVSPFEVAIAHREAGSEIGTPSPHKAARARLLAEADGEAGHLPLAASMTSRMTAMITQPAQALAAAATAAAPPSDPFGSSSEPFVIFEDSQEDIERALQGDYDLPASADHSQEENVAVGEQIDSDAEAGAIKENVAPAPASAPVPKSARKKGTGGRLSLLANSSESDSEAEEQDGDEVLLKAGPANARPVTPVQTSTSSSKRKEDRPSDPKKPRLASASEEQMDESDLTGSPSLSLDGSVGPRRRARQTQLVTPPATSPTVARTRTAGKSGSTGKVNVKGKGTLEGEPQKRRTTTTRKTTHQTTTTRTARTTTRARTPLATSASESSTASVLASPLASHSASHSHLAAAPGSPSKNRMR